MGMLLLSDNDVVFEEGETPHRPRMYFGVSGTLLYHHRFADTMTVDSKQWAAEAVLWTTEWTHRGTLMANSEVKMAALDADVFQEIAGKHGILDKKYPVDFVRQLNKSDKETLMDISGPGTS